MGPLWARCPRRHLREGALAEPGSTFDGERLTGSCVLERRLDEDAAVARADDERLAEVDPTLVANEPVLGEHGELVAETNDVAVGDANTSCPHASNESPARALEVLQVRRRRHALRRERAELRRRDP